VSTCLSTSRPGVKGGKKSHYETQLQDNIAERV